jgi:hypothetical protein
VIDIADATILVLHKGRLGGISKEDLRKVAREWQWIFANEVFVVLSRTRKVSRDVRFGLGLIHCWPVIRFLRSASLRKRRSRIVYVHVPKTGGTSMWASLCKSFPSHIYYASIDACLKNPPAPDDYDLIGLHFSPSVFSEHLKEDDWIVGMVRHPTERFLSGVMHSKRENEDPETFSPSMRAMRDMDLGDYLMTEYARAETRLQLITFGADYRHSIDALSDQELLSSALAFTRHDNVILAPSDRSYGFQRYLANRLAFRPQALGRLNANASFARLDHFPELGHAMALLNSINVYERDFYDHICRSFDAVEVTVRPSHRLFSPWRCTGINARALAQLNRQ